MKSIGHRFFTGMSSLGGRITGVVVNRTRSDGGTASTSMISIVITLHKWLVKITLTRTAPLVRVNRVVYHGLWTAKDALTVRLTFPIASIRLYRTA